MCLRRLVEREVKSEMGTTLKRAPVTASGWPDLWLDLVMVVLLHTLSVRTVLERLVLQLRGERPLPLSNRLGLYDTSSSPLE